MFLSNEKSPSTMKFQKPNILRKRLKSTAKTNVGDTLNKMSAAGQPQINFMNISDWNLEKFTKHKCSKLTHFTKKPISRIKLESYMAEENERKFNAVKNDSLNGLVHLNNHMQSADFPEISNISNSFNLQDCAFDIEGITLKDFKEVSNLDSKWCFVPIRDDRKNTLAQYDETQESKQAEISAIDKRVVMQEAMAVLNTDCDTPDCNKEFSSGQRFIKHKNTIHNKIGTQRVQSIDCPATKPGETTQCGEIFAVRDDVLKHLKEYHTLEDAVYRCESCSRRFFWSAGVRAHWRACGGARGPTRPALECQWPGCGRVFLQPCRLKEHSRAHTGDKPYPCRFPGCTWSFRTASKLLRHARRHTGERRHRCEQCGRAFLRGEHLREHVARHARPSKPPGKTRPARRKRPERLISLPFVDEPTEPTPAVEAPLLCLRVKSEPSDAATVAPITATLAPSSPVKPASDWSDEEDPFLVTVQSPATPTTPGPTETTAPITESALERSARTHCTWPLSRASTEVYVLADDAQVELSEATETESKIYTIRSDLFLHGNVIHSEDSESGVAVIAAASTDDGAESGEVEGAEGGTRDAGAGQGAALDAELGLLDATSAIDLMQEELMYTAAATDDSNFQLLSDGEYHYWLAT